MMQSPSYSKSYLKSVLRAASLAATLAAALAPSTAFASSLHLPAAMHALMGSKEKSVHFSLRNQSGAPIDLLAGDKPMTIASGGTVDVKLPVGTRIVTASKSDKREAGALICVVSASTADTTLVLN